MFLSFVTYVIWCVIAKRLVIAAMVVPIHEDPDFIFDLDGRFMNVKVHPLGNLTPNEFINGLAVPETLAVIRHSKRFPTMI